MLRLLIPIILACAFGWVRFYSLMEDHEEFKQVLKPLLIERRIGTAGHDTARKYIVGFLKSAEWRVIEQSFTHNTIVGQRNFTNIIASIGTSSPNIYLGCHYDSKIFDFNFIGATDAAVPCAMLLSIAKKIANVERYELPKVGVKLVFFDGEEAFVEWTNTDSIYGAKKLANVMSSLKVSSHSQIDHISDMHALILLDLIGHRFTTFRDSRLENLGIYPGLIEMEKKVISQGLTRPAMSCGHFTSSVN
ncbi:hypothetical protein ACOME3_003855 [Neoechinorhynchus agilis]